MHPTTPKRLAQRGALLTARRRPRNVFHTCPSVFRSYFHRNSRPERYRNKSQILLLGFKSRIKRQTVHERKNDAHSFFTTNCAFVNDLFCRQYQTIRGGTISHCIVASVSKDRRQRVENLWPVVPGTLGRSRNLDVSTHFCTQHVQLDRLKNLLILACF